MERLTRRHPDGSVGINAFRYYNYNDFQKMAKRLADYEDIGTVDELRELKEKATAKKPVKRTDNDGYVEFFCPNCEAHLFFDEEQKFCNECGQAIDLEV